MASVMRGVGHEDRISIIDHLDELRSRLVVCVVALVITFAGCFWQNAALISVLNQPLEQASIPAAGSSGALSGASEVGARVGTELAAAASAAAALSTDPATPAGQKPEFQQLAESLQAASKDLPKVAGGRQPITTGVGEPFTATLTVSAYFALLFALPVILWQIYAFILPAFSPRERRIVLPLMMMVPVLFSAGVAFGYLLVLPPAVNFLQNFNSGSFDILVQAKDYYAFVATVLLVMGLIFQVPVGLLALNRAGIVSSGALVRNWRYIIVGIAVTAAFLPGIDPVTTLLEMAPLLVLYGLSILLLKFAERRDGEDVDGEGWALDHHLDDPNADEPAASTQTESKDHRTQHEEDLSD
jgi:sec-independent protein translocase protein TatC